LQWDSLVAVVQKPTDAPPELEASSPPPPKVLAADVQMTSNDRVFEAVGTGRAKLSVQVFPSVADEVEEVHFEAGDMVNKGDLLVSLENDEELLALRLAEVAVNDSKSLLDRYENAVEKGAVPESEVDSARADYDAAIVERDQAKLAIERRKVYAPFDGFVGISNVDPGDRVDPNFAITTLDDRSVIYVDYEIPEILLNSIVAGDAKDIKVTTPAYPTREFEGRVMTTQSRVDAQRRTLTVRARIENDEDLLRPGMSFRIRWNIPGDVYPALPEIALQWARDGSFVWAVRENKAEKVMARIVARTAGMVLLDGELFEGDQVVIEGLQRLRPGVEVEVLGGQLE